MTTPRKEHTGDPTELNATPKLGRGIQRDRDVSFESVAIHQSGSKVVQRRMVDLNEQFTKRKTELADLLRSTSKKRVKKNEPSEEELLLGSKVSGVAGFPDIADAAKDARHAVPDSGMSGSGPWAPPTGSLLSDSASFSMSPIARDAASMHDAAAFFEGAITMVDSPSDAVPSYTTGSAVRTTVTSAVFTTTASTTTNTTTSGALGHGLEERSAFMEEVEEEVEGDEEVPAGPAGEEEGEEEDVWSPGEGGRAAAPATGEGATPAAALADVSYRGSSSADAAGDGCDAAMEEKEGLASGSNAPPVAKVLMFSPPPGAASRGSDSSSRTSHNATRKPFEQPPLVSFAIGSGPAEVRTPLVQQKGSMRSGGASQSADVASGRRLATSGTASGGARHLSGFISTEERTRTANGHVPKAPGSGVRDALAQEGVLDKDRDSSFEVHSGALEDSSPSSYSFIYRENLLHQLKVSTAKNEMLEGKLRDIEQLVDRNYGSISERSRLLTAERNKLERQRAALDDELVATKEELLFIRAQLQNKSARISELETELLEAQRRLMGPSDEDSQTGTDAEAGEGEGEGEEDGRGGRSGQAADASEWNAVQAPPGMLRISAGTDAGRSSSPDGEVLATVSQEEAAAIYAAGLEMDKHAQMDAREIELLKSLLVEQEQQLIEAAAAEERLNEERALAQAAADEGAALMEALVQVEAQRDALAERLEAAEQRLREAENAAFAQEARAAELEVELFRAMDAEHERALEEAKAKEAAPTTLSPPVSPKGALSVPPTLYFRSEPSPALPLRKHASAPLRIPREGYVALLMLVAFLLACVWALLILAALLYLGMLEQRFGVDILRDGGAYDQLFLLRGPRAFAVAFAQSVSAQLADVDAAEILRQLQGLSAAALAQGTVLLSEAVALAQRIAR